MAYTKYSLTPANNTATPPDGAPEGMLPSAVNDTMRDMMAQIRDVGDGIRDGTYTMTAPKITGGTITGATINNSAIGGTTAAAGKFTTLEATGVTTVQAGTVSAPAITTSGDTNTGIFFPAADTIAFAEGGTESMRIDSSGNVGIGTTSPSEKVTSNNGFLSIGAVSSLARDGAIVDYSPNVARFTAGRAGGNYGQWEAYVAGASGVTKRYQIDYDGTTYWYGSNGTSERMRIDSSGVLLVGMTSASNTTAGFYTSANGTVIVHTSSSTFDQPLLINRHSSTGVSIQFRQANVNVGSVSVTASATAYNTSSDYRLKENIAPMTSALAKVAQLKPVTYTWKIDGAAGQGFIAHELQEIVPDCVTGEKDAVDADGKPVYQGVDTSFLVATLTSAIQELHEIVKAQAAEIALLKSK